MMAESSSVQFGQTAIRYAIQRSGRRKTVAITVDPTAGVLVTAPEDTSVRRLDDVVHGKAIWILDRLKNARRVEPRSPREFVSGESFHYLGRQFRLRTVHHEEAAEPKLERGWLVVRVEPSAQAAEVRAAVTGWYVQHARERLPERAEIWHRRVGVPLPEVLVRGQKKRWGSCDASGRVRINWRIVQAPMRLVDYVVVHELVHLTHENHTPAFWSLLGRVLPDYDRRKEDLRRAGPAYEW